MHANRNPCFAVNLLTDLKNCIGHLNIELAEWCYALGNRCHQVVRMVDRCRAYTTFFYLMRVNLRITSMLFFFTFSFFMVNTHHVLLIIIEKEFVHCLLFPP